MYVLSIDTKPKLVYQKWIKVEENGRKNLIGSFEKVIT